MKILLYSLNHAPELTGVGKYTGELAAWLAARGHEVRVVAAPPYYPEWRIRPGFSGRLWRREQRDGATVWRCPLWVPSRPRGVSRVLHLLSFAITSAPVMLAQALWRPKVVWLVEPTLLCAPLAWLAARLAGARAWLHVQDFEVDAAFELGLLPEGRARGWANAAERALMRGFDRVSTISPRMLDRLAAKGVNGGVLFPNWVDTDAIFPLPAPSPLRAELGITAGQPVALYAGNMGAKQGLEILAQVARSLQDSSVQFVFCGEGPGRAALESACVGMKQVRFLDLQPPERLNALLNLADIHLLPQRADAADLVMPSKLTGMLASGRPVVATASPGTQLAQAVAGRGAVVPPGDGVAMAQAIATLAQQPAERARLGQAARSFALEHLGREAILSAFEAQLSAA